MDPIGAATKDDYVKNQVMNSVRTAFDNLVFGKSYLGVTTEEAHRNDPNSTSTAVANFKYYNPDMQTENLTKDNLDAIVTSKPYK
jgi:hypothetical protein